jgi:hypothetical protein
VAEESDLIWGAECIKDFLRDHCGMTDVTTKAVYHLADRNRLPIAKFNGKLFVSRSAILSHFREALDQAAQRCEGRGSAAPEVRLNQRLGRRYRIR